jgi:hypothetical protein
VQAVLYTAARTSAPIARGTSQQLKQQARTPAMSRPPSTYADMAKKNLPPSPLPSPAVIKNLCSRAVFYTIFSTPAAAVFTYLSSSF